MTLITEKYKYTELKRNTTPQGRKYLTPEGHAVASVTTILDSTQDKTHLHQWRNRVGTKRAAEITTEASHRGTRIHKYLEDYILSGEWPTPGSNPYAQEANRMAHIIKENALCDMTEIWGTEVNLWIPQIYAGTTDMCGCYRGNPAICDFKQSNKPKKESWINNYKMQLVAYAEAHNEVYGTTICEGHVFMVNPSTGYQQFDIWPDEYDHWKKCWWDAVYKYYENTINTV